MILDKDHALVHSLLRSTQNRKTEWLPTAVSNEFTTSFSGKFGVVVGANESRGDAWLVITDAGGTTLHRLTDEDNANIYELFELARRNALHVDEAIDSILVELDEGTAPDKEEGPEANDEDIPF
jgi:hypothetical protein